MRLQTRWSRLLIFLLLLGLAPAVQAGAVLQVYDDSFLAGFEDRQWRSRNLTNTSPVHSGACSISVTPAAFWEGIYVHHTGLDTTPYTRLTFWANGGPVGGQRLQVQGLLSGSNPPPEVYYRVTLATNTWQWISVPLASLGATNKDNLTGFWIQLTPNGRSNTFFLDDIQFAADETPETALATALAASATATPPSLLPGMTWTAAAWSIVGALVIITALLAWLIVMLRRSGLGKSQALVPMASPSWAELGPSLEGAQALTDDAVRRVLETPADPQVRAIRERVATELAEFAKQSLVQGLYSQRGKLMETQQKAQAELVELETRLAMLQLPLQERIRAYEARIGELEKQLETRDDEMRNMIQATLSLVRERLEKEKVREPDATQFN